jgi:hypothetical protein
MSSPHRDYIPGNAAQFKAFMSHLLYYVSGKKANKEWENIPEERVSALTAVFENFDMAYNSALKTTTHSNILARKEAQTMAVKELREFVNQFLRFLPVTNPDRAEMGIPNHDNIRTDHTVVTELVDFVIHLRGIRELVVDFWIQGADHKAKPRHYDGAVIVWGVLDAPPLHTDDLIHHAMASRTPYTIHFDEADRGKTAYIALVWQNGRGILGQWSEFKGAVVP